MQPPQLNYQPSHSAVYYTPPRQFDVGRTILGFAIAVVVAVIGAFIYAKIQPHAQRKLDIRPIINQLMVTPEEAQMLRGALKQIAENSSA